MPPAQDQPPGPPHHDQRFAAYKPERRPARPMTDFRWWVALLTAAVVVGGACIVAALGFIAVLKGILS